jgi:hypothetical protein
MVIETRMTSLDAATGKSLELIEQTRNVSRSIDSAASSLTNAVLQLKQASEAQSARQNEMVGGFFDQAGTAIAELTVQLNDAAQAMRSAAEQATRR